MNANVYRKQGVRFVDPPVPWRVRLVAWARRNVRERASVAFVTVQLVLYLPVIVLFVSLRIVITLARVLLDLCALPFVAVYTAVTGQRVELIINS